MHDIHSEDWTQVSAAALKFGAKRIAPVRVTAAIIAGFVLTGVAATAVSKPLLNILQNHCYTYGTPNRGDHTGFCSIIPKPFTK